MFCLYTLDGTLNSDIAGRALVQCTDIIVESGIDPFVLARKLYSKEVMPEDVYKKVKDKECRDTNEERLDKILDFLKNRIKHNADILKIFCDVLRNLSRNELADIIIAKYKGTYKCLF